MTLEHDIQQSKFGSERQKVLLNILYTHNFLLNKMTTSFKKYGITRQQYNVLRILNGQFPQPATINLIKDRMLDKMSDASRIVDRLYKKKLVDKQLNKLDRRATDITISKTGKNLLNKMEPVVKSFDDLIAPLTKKEAVDLNNLLDKLRK